jgi:hypothetical protein
MWCAECGAEWKEGITSCPDCHVPLVDEPPEASRADDELVSVFQTTVADTLPVVKTALDAAGIPYLVQGDEAFGVLPINVAILVPADRADEARELISEDARSEPPTDD